jgi:hypothetical protein
MKTAKRSFVFLAGALLSASLLFGHGDPIVGTVTDVKSDNFTIKDKDGKNVVIMVTKDTKYLMNKKAATKADLKVGVRVTIDAEMDTKMKMYHAHEIEIGTAPAAAPKTTATHLKGSVTAVTKDTVAIKLQDGKTETVMLEKTTKYSKDKKTATVTDVKVGSPVDIRANTDAKMKMYVAEEIEIGAAPAPASKG